MSSSDGQIANWAQVAAALFAAIALYLNYRQQRIDGERAIAQRVRFLLKSTHASFLRWERRMIAGDPIFSVGDDLVRYLVENYADAASGALRVSSIQDDAHLIVAKVLSDNDEYVDLVETLERMIQEADLLAADLPIVQKASEVLRGITSDSAGFTVWRNALTKLSKDGLASGGCLAGVENRRAVIRMITGSVAAYFAVRYLPAIKCLHDFQAELVRTFDRLPDNYVAEIVKIRWSNAGGVPSYEIGTWMLQLKRYLPTEEYRRLTDSLDSFFKALDKEAAKSRITEQYR